MRLGLGGVGEEAGRLDHHVGTDFAPGQLARIALGVGHDLVAVDRDRLVVEADLTGEAMQDRVVLEQMGEGLVVGQIVDADNLYVGTGGGERPEVVATDPAESVDTNLHRHVMVPLRLVFARSQVQARVDAHHSIEKGPQW